MVPPAGVEPATWWVEATRSIQLSYRGAAVTTLGQDWPSAAVGLACGKLKDLGGRSSGG